MPYFFPAAIKLSEVLESWLFQETSLSQTVVAMTTPTETDQEYSGRRRMPAAEAYDVMITVVNPEPEKLHLNWDLPQVIQGDICCYTVAFMISKVDYCSCNIVTSSRIMQVPHVLVMHIFRFNSVLKRFFNAIVSLVALT
jgi:hypothetical protein